MKTILEFDMAVPDDRKKSRIVEDEDGFWRIQSLRTSWQDEYRMDSEWPEKVPTVVKNLSSILKAVAGAKNEKAASIRRRSRARSRNVKGASPDRGD